MKTASACLYIITIRRETLEDLLTQRSAAETRTLELHPALVNLTVPGFVLSNFEPKASTAWSKRRLPADFDCHNYILNFSSNRFKTYACV
jgi:hypothetical protein